MNPMNWPVVHPELWLLVAACGVLLADLFSNDAERRPTFWLTQAAVAVFAWLHLERALAAFRRALFLQPDFVLAHYQYGLLLLGSGRRERGLRSLQTVRRLIAHAPADRELQGAEHLSYGRMAQIIDNELSIHHES